MNSEILSKIKSEASSILKSREILDIIVFGSAVKGKVIPSDIDIAVISEKIMNVNLSNFHIICLKPIDFFKNPPPIITTLLREGYSLKNNKPFSEIYSFLSRVIFIYELKGLDSSGKVKIVNNLRGIREEKGMVEQNKGEWLANQVFIVPVENEHIFEKFF